MGKVVASASMSLDGYIAKADNTIGHLFDWLNCGEVEFPTINPDITFHLNQTSFDYMQAWISSLGALVCGRTLFDFTDGWGGRHTMDVPGVVVTHKPPAEWIAAHPNSSFEFVTGRWR
jgi:dihydrofolate reductase